MNKSILLLAFLLLNSYSCMTVPWESSGTFIGANGFKDYKNLNEQRIEGESCRYFGPFALPFGWGSATLSAAFAEAMKNAPAGTQGLSDAEMYQTDTSILLLNRKCVTINGYPARRK